MTTPAHTIPPRERVIVALDVPDCGQLATLLDRLDGRPAFYKVGLELFVAEGERAVEMVQARGGRVFLDLKLHDIPETVARAVTSAARVEAELLTVHTSGGYEMLSRAAEAAAGRVKILGVTVLTSLAEDDRRWCGRGRGSPRGPGSRAWSARRTRSKRRGARRRGC
jgi:orotidine-5'-phosphate decarboxylase